MRFTKITLAAALLGALTAATGADAATRWQRHHPWRTYDNARLAVQNHRIRQGVRLGQITPSQARALRSNEHAIRTEERADASIHGSHLSRGEQQAITAQENASSRAIYAVRHHCGDASQPSCR